MKLERFLASLINSILFIVNIVLWIFGIDPIGQMFFKTAYPTSRFQQFVFGLLTVIMLGSLIGFIINIYFWWTEQSSLPTMITKMFFA